MTNLSHFACVDCGVDTSVDAADEYYMVHDHVWKLSGMSKRTGAGMLCIGCLEGRIGRELNAGDFTDAPINWMWPGSERLYDRKNKKKKVARRA